jgi:uncharacterized protein (TIRG00374 family)
VRGQYAADGRDLYASSRDLRRVRPLTVTTGLSVLSWGLECVAFWLVLTGFDAGVSLLIAAFVFAVSSIVGAVSLLPGGLGATEGTMTSLLVAFGVGRSVAAGSAIVVRAATLWFSAGLALLVYLNFRRRWAVVSGRGDKPD